MTSSQFISQTRSRQLIGKLIEMAGPSHRDELKTGNESDAFVKTPNSQLIYTIQTIQQAIRSDRKITFQYFGFNLQKEYIPRHDGKWYVISPYVTVWKQERYFLIGWSDEREKVIVFRIDRMGLPRMLGEPGVRPPEGFDIRDYTERIFNMYDDGIIETVALRGTHPMISHIIDFFGEEVEPFNITDVSFDVRIRVCPSATFFAWVLGFGGQITIIGPPHVTERYRSLLLTAAECELPVRNKTDTALKPGQS